MQICRILVAFGIYDEYNKIMVKIKYKQIRKYINLKKFTLKQFCELVGITQRELNKILNGEYDFKFSSLIKISNFIHIPIEELIDFGKIKVQTSFYI